MTHDDQPTLSSNRWNDLKTLPSPNMFKIWKCLGLGIRLVAAIECD